MKVITKNIKVVVTSGLSRPNERYDSLETGRDKCASASFHFSFIHFSFLSWKILNRFSIWLGLSTRKKPIQGIFHPASVVPMNLRASLTPPTNLTPSRLFLDPPESWHHPSVSDAPNISVFHPSLMEGAKVAAPVNSKSHSQSSPVEFEELFDLLKSGRSQTERTLFY